MTIIEHPFALARDVIVEAIVDLEDQIDQLTRALALLDHRSTQPPALAAVPDVEDDPTPPHGIPRPEPVPPRTWEPVECPVCGRECHPNGIGPHMRKHANDDETVGDVAEFDPDKARAAAAASI